MSDCTMKFEGFNCFQIYSERQGLCHNCANTSEPHSPLHFEPILRPLSEHIRMGTLHQELDEQIDRQVLHAYMGCRLGRDPEIDPTKPWFGVVRDYDAYEVQDSGLMHIV